MYKRIRDLREDRDLKQRELAEILIKLSNYYNVSIDYILGQTDSPKRKK